MDAAARTADRSRLPEVEEEIRLLEIQLAALRDERTNIRARLDGYKYPVLTALPNEIVTEIFTQYIPPYPACPPLLGPDSPTSLMGICRLWRSIALHSPVLWRAIRYDSDSHDSDEQGLHAALTWLQRSGRCLLSLDLELHNSSGTEMHNALLEAVIRQRSRWEYVFFRLWPSQILLLSGPAPAMVRMNVVSWHDEPSADENIVFHDVSQLQSVFLWDVGYSLGSLPWAQLTSLHCFHANLAHCGPILQHASNLLFCKLVLLTTDVEGIDIRLPKLQVLVLLPDTDWNETHASVDCLSYFTLQSLQKLEIAGDSFGLNIVIQQLRSLFVRSHCQLRRLRIRTDYHPVDYAIATCLEAFPNVNVDGADAGHLLTEDASWMSEKYWNDVLLVTSDEVVSGETSVDGRSEED